MSTFVTQLPPRSLGVCVPAKVTQRTEREASVVLVNTCIIMNYTHKIKIIVFTHLKKSPCHEQGGQIMNIDIIDWDHSE